MNPTTGGSGPRWPTVLFDLDGTTANTIPLILDTYRWTMAQHGLPEVDEATILSHIGRTLPDTYASLAPGHVNELIGTHLAYQATRIEELLEGYDGVPALVGDLMDAGVTTGIVTSRRRESAEALVAALGLADALPVVIAAEDTTRHKPSPDPLLAALDRLGVAADGAVYVGDAVVDLRAARAAGLPGVGVTWGAGVPEDLQAEPSVAVVDSVAGLRGILFAG